MRNRVLAVAGLMAWTTLEAADFQWKPKFYADDPLWRMPQPAPAENVRSRKLSDYYDFLENTFFQRGEHVSAAGTWLPSQAINTVDEVPDSAWYTNRHARKRMTEEELKRGPGDSHAPAAGAFTVVAAKNEGVTPGFVIRDAQGRKYVVKFDPLSNPEMASAADVISSKFFHALGYNVPENYILYFERSRITLAAGATIKDERGRKRPMRTSDIDAMLAKVRRTRDGRYRALASLFVPGKLLGPFRYYGTRGDDPNDLVPHEHRRDLRALHTFCAWLDHDDSRAVNTLDTLLTQDGVPFVAHYLIDFGATLGSASFAANSPRSGNAYLFAWKSAAFEFASLGLYAPKWQRARYPDLPAVGRFEYETFDPAKWVPDYPNAAFRNENPSDRAWAARKLLAFTDEDIRAVVSTGQYSDPAAAEWVTRCLVERRNKIVRAFLPDAAALDEFAVEDGRLVFGNLISPRPRIQWSTFDNASGMRRAIAGARSWEIPRVNGDYLVADITGDANTRISVYLSCRGGRPQVVGIERHFGSHGRG